MKTSLRCFSSIFFIVLYGSSLLAQAPDAINYQAAARNTAGDPMANQNITVRLGIYSGAIPTTLVYEELHNLTTSATGIFTLAIGQGSVESGNFANIDWGADRYHLKVEIDAGSGFIEMGTLPFLSVPYALYAKEAGNTFALPFDGSISVEGQTAFKSANTHTGNGLAITGIQGGGSSIGTMSRSAIWGTAETGHGVVGFTSGNGAWAGIWGRTNNRNGYGVHGSASAGGIGGYFEAIGDNAGPALITGAGRIGFGTPSPEKFLQVEGDLFVNSSKGAIDFGYPDNGNQWHLSTLNAGEDLQFFSKADGSAVNSRRLIFKQNGQVGIGNLTNPTGQMEIASNSTAASAHLTLTEAGNDFARLNFRNTEASAKFWSIAGYNASTISNERLNFYHSITGNLLTIRGDGNVGVFDASPTARLHIGQQGQAVGNGLRFDDGVNQDWDITHGFGLRFHYGGALRSFINATTGAYTQSSDRRLKTDMEAVGTVLPQVNRLKALRYQYITSAIPEKTLGFIAQDVLPLFPELVHYSQADDLYGINYAGFSVIAIKAIQEQQTVMDEQQQTIDDLLKRVEALEKILYQMP
ncbi:tail fiber domain-containing protein [Rapidithrix thailandica]|uniref:Tail fiber domain-containing protein n=1 Tax=Rapidithrix thailandica TaxID=413964 RepID=A0AAW9S8E3_9BACT